MENKDDRRTKRIKTIKVLSLLFGLIVAFLFALNGRYMDMGDDYVFDKWTRNLLELARIRTVE